MEFEEPVPFIYILIKLCSYDLDVAGQLDMYTDFTPYINAQLYFVLVLAESLAYSFAIRSGPYFSLGKSHYQTPMPAFGNLEC